MCCPCVFASISHFVRMLGVTFQWIGFSDDNVDPRSIEEIYENWG